jgi:1-acyl-sn-glycerol-3-phosphate acyltransferase
MAVTVEGRENLDPRRSYVIVSNHQSHYDIFVLYGWLGTDFRWVMKKELRSVPGLGVACARLGHIYIDRSNRQAAMAAIDDAKRSLRPGTSVLFFPEGTRSRDGSLCAFKKGAFHMAIDLGLPILPVTILGTRRILPPDSTDLKPGRARLVFHPPVPVDGRSREDIPDLMAEVRDAVAAPFGPAGGLYDFPPGRGGGSS